MMPEIGFLAAAASWTITFFGLPAQIIKNYRRKSCDGISPVLIIAPCASYTLWSLYGLTKPDWIIVAAQAPGMVFAFTILAQMIYYRTVH